MSGVEVMGGVKFTRMMIFMHRSNPSTLENVRGGEVLV